MLMTLLDVAAITGISPTGEAYDPDREYETQFFPDPVTYAWSILERIL